MRTIVITGASSGVGLAAAKQLAAMGDQIVAVGRDPRRLGAAMAEIRKAATGPEPDEVRADFETLEDVRLVAEHVLSAYEKIDVLANNAGGMLGSYRVTPDGFEATAQSNHLAPFLLANLLRERLSGGRIIGTSSDAHRRARVDPDDFTGDPQAWSAWRAYGAAKGENILFAAEAARRWPDILSVSFHPGLVRTNFGADPATRLVYKIWPFLITAQKAGALLTWLATAPANELTTGAYYVGRKVTEPRQWVTDPELAARLWTSSAQAVNL
ncbi:SDR family oxidoreductase [Winogradskya consettensis]|uniref:Short-chain dehydrogenase n=1 Tax=Winogradskya consettensis TaxID=113560 RepID=A0A919VTH2_9ACTN|nr:SDR family NAD(P)-dependent oxidoreductase [Actinoplanes consettensis]GIM75252.1 short-chain dehydrogenase [Actinoplanes consettensis]